MRLIETVFLLSFTFNCIFGATDKVVCYYESWTDESQFKVDEIDVDICTHVNFAFLRLNDDGTFRFDGGADDSGLVKFGALKSKNPNVKLLITVGGWTEDSAAFSHVASDDHKKLKLATTVVNYMRKYGLDGVDLDWEYPGKHGGKPEDKENYVGLLQVIRNTLDENGGGVLTIAVSSVPDPSVYNVNSLSKIVDFINVMTFDFHGSTASDNKTGANSPLYASSSDSEWEKNYANCDASLNNWLNSGANPSKLILGLGFYGHVFQLVDPRQHSTGSPANGADPNYTSYYKICNLTDGWTAAWDDEQQVPYIYSEKEWISYDNPKSIAVKVQYAKSRNLGGVMLYAVNDDDKSAICGEKNPLLSAIKANL
ncbi:acidic mammalian chitinase [Tribolium castaneum]|uniref:Putative chitinase 2-like protein n=1 Tax=Tribolium castaneum TaxID=7070 RepID=A0A139WFN2_TRICA|nr:PREDICTED: acidic mammalian chitinase isoform X2 [Tribolium castaneum]KYB26651.1 putative chitinase 2-like protein [Tribolium castaneum]|eukprot:XP_008195467.1 PREDICTED: acidic mammalian chitinase isoform X2 [Tribolium castaneum]